MKVMKILRQYDYTTERCDHWVKPFQVRITGRGIEYVDFKGVKRPTDVIGYGHTLREAAKNALEQLPEFRKESKK